jgi:hypothetical protein
MISASPHLYEQDAAARGIPPKIARRALEQAKQPERKGLPAILTLRHLQHVPTAMNRDSQDTPEVRV